MKLHASENVPDRSRSLYAWRLVASVLVWIQHRLARRHLAQGLPQLAAFSFDHIAIRINAFGRYERDELDALIVFLRGKRLVKGACLDIGANIGNHAIFFASYFTEVHAFEPGPSTFLLLSHNATLKPNVHCHNVGVSDSTREAYWSAPTHNIGEGAISDNDFPGSERHRTTVRLVDIDSLAAIQDLDIGLIKIDVEGHEAAVLDGARSTIKKNSPVIIFEQQAREIINGSSPTIDRLRALGYGDYYSFMRSPTSSSKVVTAMLRLLLGERCSFGPLARFDPMFYSMIVAIK